MTNSIGAVLASKKRKHIIRAFKNAGAVSPESTKTLEALGLVESMMFKIQKLKGVIIEAEPNHYYLNEEREASIVRLRIALVIVISALLMVLLFLSRSH